MADKVPIIERPKVPVETPAPVEAPRPVEEREVVEQAPEKPVEAPAETEAAPMAEVPKAPVRVAPAAPAVVPKDRLSREIEAVMEEDLTDVFLKMPPAKQQEFKLKGEETASKIRQLAAKAQANAKKIFSLLRDWLKLIPGVNRFFLEQEAKIKTDKIVLLAEEEKREGPLT